MNDAHLHMVFNHFPIIGLFFGIGILAYGIIKKQTILVNTAYVIFIVCMIMAKATMMTGEGAEEAVEPGLRSGSYRGYQWQDGRCRYPQGLHHSESQRSADEDGRRFGKGDERGKKVS